MTLFNKIRGAKKTLGTLLLAGTMAIAGVGCGGGGGGGSSKPKNSAPVITTSSLADALEDISYEQTITATDANSDDLNFTLVEKPLGTSLVKTGKYTAKLSGVYDDSVSGMNHTVKIRVDDGKAMTEKTYTLKIINTEDLSFEVYDAENGGALPSVEIKLDDGDGHVYTAQTGFLGTCQIDNVRDGSYDSKLEHLAATHETHLPGIFKVSKTDNTSAQAVMYDKADSDFVTNTIRYNGEVRKWKTKPKFRIYTKEVQGGGDVAGATVTAIKDAIKTELNQFNQDAFTDFADADIEEVATLPTPGFDAGYIKVYWDNTFGGGGNASEFSGNEIIASASRFNTSVGKPVHLQELTENLIGTGETNDASYSTSVLYDPVTANAYSTKDMMLSKMVYNLGFLRPAGNKDEATAGRRDVNPSTHQWNKTLVAPAVLGVMEYKDPCPDEEYPVGERPFYLPEPIPSGDREVF